MILQRVPAASPLLWTHQPDPFDSTAAIYSFVHGSIAARIKVTTGSDMAVATLMVGRWAILDKEQLPIREAFAQIHDQISELAKQFTLATKVPFPLAGTRNIKVYLDPDEDLTRWILTFVSPTIDANPQRHFPHWSYCVQDRYSVRRQDGAKMTRVE